jgi:hypothetical protein
MKQPSALLRSLELATASPAVARLAANCFLAGCILRYLIEGVLSTGFVRMKNAHIPWKIFYDEVLIVLEGELRVHANDDIHELSKYDSLWLPAGTDLIYEAKEALITYAIHPSF